MNLGTVWDITKATFVQWVDDKAPRLAAALAYYTVFAIAPTLVIVIAVASIVFGQDAAKGKIVGQIEGLVGHDGATAVQTALLNSAKDNSGTLAATLGFIALIAGATTVFVELQDSLNTIWGVKPKPGRGIKGMLRDRFLSFAMVIGVGFILMVSLIISAAISALGDWAARLIPDGGLVVILQIAQLVLSLVIFTVLIGAIYKVLPDVRIGWRDVLVGGAITAVLFTLGKFLIGLYLGQSTVSSTYGAAGSLAVLFVWVYYSALIFFLGAEFTQVYSNRFGSHVAPSEHAVLVGRKSTVGPDGIATEDQEARADKEADRISG